MANQERNGRNVTKPEGQRPSWRPHEDNQPSRRSMSDGDDWDDGDRSIEHYGQGQSGYAAGRHEGDRSYGSRNQSAMSDSDHARDRGGDERFSGGRGGANWSPDDRGDHGMHGSSYGQQSNYGHPGHWTDERRQQGYGNARENRGMQPAHAGGRGVQGHGGMYGQGGYNEGMYGRGGQQDRYGSQGYGQEDKQHDRVIGEGRYSSGPHGARGWPADAGPHGHDGGSGSGYGHQPEHEVGFGGNQPGYSPGRGPQRVGLVGDEFSHEQMYGRQRGPHRGKGPSGYTRSDDRIREIVCDVLTDHDDIDASHIEITVKNGEVTLGGTVEERRTKRLAEDVIENLSGVKDVVNQIRVIGGPAIEKSPREQNLQGNDKRHRA